MCWVQSAYFFFCNSCSWQATICLVLTSLKLCSFCRLAINFQIEGGWVSIICANPLCQPSTELFFKHGRLQCKINISWISLLQSISLYFSVVTLPKMKKAPWWMIVAKHLWHELIATCSKSVRIDCGDTLSSNSLTVHMHLFIAFFQHSVLYYFYFGR